eukprot:gene19449-25330_t
MGILQVSTTIH